MSRDDMFSRWSERRARVAREEEDAKRPAVDSHPDAPDAPEVPEPRTEAEEDALLVQLGLPRPEDVTGPEIRAFLARSVPEVFRRRAMRALWRSDPAFAVLDGLNDYDQDFNHPELNQRIFATAYQVGKGIVRRIETTLDADGAAEADRAKTAEAPPAPGPEATAVLAPPAPPAVEPAPADQADQADPQDEPPAPAFAPRRMTFET